MAIDVEALYERFGPMVARRCRMLLSDDDKAHDAMHDVFVLLLRHQDRLDDTAPSSLLYRMATNVCLNRIRTEKRHPEHRDEELLFQIASAHDPDRALSARTLLGALFRREEETSRTIAVLHLLDGMTYDEIAPVVGLSSSGVRKRMRRMRETLEALHRADAGPAPERTAHESAI